jgi:hypothetical protein
MIASRCVEFHARSDVTALDLVAVMMDGEIVEAEPIELLRPAMVV